MRQTDFSNDEAVGYLADRLARLGVEDALFKAGADAGAEVVIGAGDNAVVFDWEPTMAAGAELLAGPRGTDVRLLDDSRPTREAKRERYASGGWPRPPRARSSAPSAGPATGPTRTTSRRRRRPVEDGRTTMPSGRAR